MQISQIECASMYIVYIYIYICSYSAYTWPTFPTATPHPHKKRPRSAAPFSTERAPGALQRGNSYGPAGPCTRPPAAADDCA